MNCPTLYKIGSIVTHDGMSARDIKKAESQKPIEFITDFILDRVPRRKGLYPRVPTKSPGERILLLESATGSGKSTAIAPSIHKKEKHSIVLTQPRILTTVEIVYDIMKYNAEFGLGKTIGYQTGAMKNTTTQKGINLMTAGILLQQFMNSGVDKVAETYDIIMIDEIHEKAIEMDLIMYFLKKLSEIPNVFIVLMSATFEVDKYLKFFGIPKSNYIKVAGFSYPIKDVWLKYPTNDYIRDAVSLVKQIHAEGKDDFTSKQRDIIIFVKGQAEINSLLEKLEGADENLYPLALTRQIFTESGKKYRHIMADEKEIGVGVRRVILATNIAETGLTIDSLKYCIDTGYYINVWDDPIFGAKVIQSSPVTRFMAMQRRGRVGRKAPGIWYPLYTKQTFDSLLTDQYSKMITSDISTSILSIIIAEADRSWSPYSLEMLDTPAAATMQFALEKLHFLGFIDSNFQATQLGKMAVKIRRLPLECIRMIFAGYAYKSSILDLITIAAFVEIGYPPVDSDKMIACNFVGYLYEWDSFTKMKFDKLMALPNLRMLLDVAKRRDEIIEDMISANLNPFYNGLGLDRGTYNLPKFIKEDLHMGLREVSKIKQCLVDGFRLYICELVPDTGKYQSVMKGMNIHIKQIPILPNDGNRPRFIITNGVISRDRGFTSGDAISILDGFVPVDKTFHLF